MVYGMGDNICVIPIYSILNLSVPLTISRKQFVPKLLPQVQTHSNPLHTLRLVISPQVVCSLLLIVK